MKKNLQKILLLGFLILLISSCAYSVHRTPYEAIAIGRIENKTFERGLEDKLQMFLAEELMRNGIKIDSRSPYRIEGAIERFELKGIAQKDEITVKFEVFVEASLRLKTPDGEMPIKTSSIFPVTFSSEGLLEEITAFKENAENQAIKDLASEAVAAILFRQR